MKKIFLMKKSLPKSNVDLIAGTIVAILGLTFIFCFIPYYIDLGFGSTKGLNPRTFPYYVSILFTFLGFCVLKNGYTECKKNKNSETKCNIEIISFYFLAVLITLLGIFFGLTIKIIGYPLANIICMIVIYYIYGGRNIKVCLILAGISTLLFWLFFATYLHLSIPLGFGL